MGLAARIEPSVEEFVAARQRRMLIDGKWVEAASGKTFETLDPATGKVLARVAEGGRGGRRPRGARRAQGVRRRALARARRHPCARRSCSGSRI